MHTVFDKKRLEMCGIAGFVDFNLHTTESVLHDMTDVLHHRGPDDSGYYFDNGDTAYIGLGHRRLSVLDLSSHGQQPMLFQNTVISYNGEVYNFKEIRKELEKCGYSFDSNTDTEVILKSYHCWGTEMVHRFNGMFAFALYDKPAQKVFFFRDRAGVKPLYWYFRDNIFLFASELKSFHQNPWFKKEINNNSLALFLQYGYILQPHTIFNNCCKLKGGYYLTLDLRKRSIEETEYWNVIDCYLKPKIKISEKEAIDETEKILKSAFEYRMIADVPVGMFLSGGYDSSVVTAILQANHTEKLKTFTIGFPEAEYDEAIHAKKIADYLGTDHTEYYCTQKDVLDILPLLPEIWDEPFGDSSAIPTTLVSRLARSRVAVSLSADGGDEVFGGYNKYLDIKKMKLLLDKLPGYSHTLLRSLLQNPLLKTIAGKNDYKNIWKKCSRMAVKLGCNDIEILSILQSNFMKSELKELLKVNFDSVYTGFDDEINVSLFDNIMAIDYKTYQADDILTKVDRATMSVSLEGREPLLDYRIIEFAAQLEPSLKIKNNDKKYILKQIAYKYMPKELLDRPKMGFGIPVNKWFRGSLKDTLLYYLDEQKLIKDMIFNVNEVTRLKDNYLTGKDNIAKVWFILIFQMWKEKWLE